MKPTAPLAALLLCLSAAGCASLSDAHMPEDQSPERTEIDDTINNWHHAASIGDLDTYQKLMTPDAVFLGTDRTERWVGQQFIDFARPYFEDGQGWTYTTVDRHVTVDGDVAWFDEVLTNENYGYCRGTGVLVQIDKRWRIAHYGLAFLVPNGVAKQTRAIVAEYEQQEAKK